MLSSLPRPLVEAIPPSPETAAAGGVATRAMAAGNPPVFDDIVREHSRRVFNFLYQLTGHRQDTEDLTQQTFIKAYHNLHRFDVTRPMINWLLTIARRTA